MDASLLSIIRCKCGSYLGSLTEDLENRLKAGVRSSWVTFKVLLKRTLEVCRGHGVPPVKYRAIEQVGI